MFAEAQAEFAAEDAAAALRLVESAIALDSETDPAVRGYYTLRAACMAELGDTHGDDAVTHYNDAKEATARGDFVAARRLYELALVKDPLMLWAANNRAWLAATHPSREARVDPDAVAYALYACVKSDWHNWSFIDTLGAIYAESGDYDAAMRCAERAIALAPMEFRQEVRDSLATYRQRQPRRDDDAPVPQSEADDSGGQRVVMEHVTVRDIAQTMKQEGYAVTIRDPGFVEWKIEGKKAQIFVADDGQSVQFHSVFTGSRASLAKVNEWNRTKKYSRSYLDEEGDSHLELDLDYGGGITEARVVDFLITCRLSFVRWVEEVVE